MLTQDEWIALMLEWSKQVLSEIGREPPDYNQCDYLRGRFTKIMEAKPNE
jgi:hypothetical protein